MGQAVARTLLSAGRPATVWNRTAARAGAAVTAGAKRTTTPR
ncbi:NAD(P)-binding domain-containing protein [Streptomyces olivaceus]